MKINFIKKIIEPQDNINWLQSHTGASSVVVNDTDSICIYLTGRDQNNRSLIGRVHFNMSSLSIDKIEPAPILSYGDLGAFDENGVSYPCVVQHNQSEYLFYTGWRPTVLVPFLNEVGLAIKSPQQEGYTRFSRAPLLVKTNQDYLGTGSCWVIRDNDQFVMWYTSFLKWEKLADNSVKHYYNIKYATSKDLIHWDRKDSICFPDVNPDTYCVAKPTVIKVGEQFHMLFTHRGDDYKIAYATSNNGIDWDIKEKDINIKSGYAFDDRSQCYPTLFKYQDKVYLLYCGNDYGQGGVGLAEVSI